MGISEFDRNAPWRDDPRPPRGSIQGIHAFFGIARFRRTRMIQVDGDEREISAYAYAHALQQTVESAPRWIARR